MKIQSSQKNDLLTYVFAGGGILVLSLFAPDLPFRILKAYLKNQEYQKTKLRNNILGLRKQGLINVEKDKSQYILKITDQGKLQAKLLEAINCPIEEIEPWNNKWHLTIFDISEKKRKARHRISAILQNIGCVQVQKSVYLSPYHFREKLLIIARYYQVERSFFYFEIYDQAAFQNFKKYFNL